MKSIITDGAMASRKERTTDGVTTNDSTNDTGELDDTRAITTEGVTTTEEHANNKTISIMNATNDNDNAIIEDGTNVIEERTTAGATKEMNLLKMVLMLLKNLQLMVQPMIVNLRPMKMLVWIHLTMIMTKIFIELTVVLFLKVFVMMPFL